MQKNFKKVDPTPETLQALYTLPQKVWQNLMDQILDFQTCASMTERA